MLLAMKSFLSNVRTDFVVTGHHLERPLCVPVLRGKKSIVVIESNSKRGRLLVEKGEFSSQKF